MCVCECIHMRWDAVLFLLQIDEDLTARVNMADYKFTFHEKGKEYNPSWMAPEGKWLFIYMCCVKRLEGVVHDS